VSCSLCILYGLPQFSLIKETNIDYIYALDKSLTPARREEICGQALNRSANALTLVDQGTELYNKGVHFLYKHGLVFVIPFNQLTISSGNKHVQIPIWNCGNCSGDCNDVSFRAHLIGTDAILHATVSKSHYYGDYMIEVEPPPVNGIYRLSVVVRWWHGLEDPSPNSLSYFLGPNDHQLNFKRPVEFQRVEEACNIYGFYGSPVNITVAGEMGIETSQLPLCNTTNEPGYWERVNRSNICSDGDEVEESEGKCFVLDDVNAQWLWRGRGCRFKFLTPDQIGDCLADTTIVISGDSISSEFYHNLIHYVPQCDKHLVWKPTYKGPTHVKRMKMEHPFGGINVRALEMNKRVIFVSDFNVAHLIWENQLRYLNAVTIPNIEQRWISILKSSEETEVQGIYYAGYPLYFEKYKHMTYDRMVIANSLLEAALKNLSFSVADTFTPLLSRPDASWDGNHFLQVLDKLGGASKMVTMMLLHQICLSR